MTKWIKYFISLVKYELLILKIMLERTLESSLCAFLKEVDAEKIDCERDLQHLLYDKLVQDGWRVYPEVDVSFELFASCQQLLKKKVDLLAEKDGRRIVIELKVPLNKAYPKRMCHAVVDIAFLEQLKRQDRRFSELYFIMLVKDKGFYLGPADKVPYSYFRGGLCLSVGETALPYAYKGCKNVCLRYPHSADWLACKNDGKFLCVQI